MATIGRHAAVANVRWPFKAHWSGFLAWLAWLIVHLFFLIGFRNRLPSSSWAWTYLTFNRGARLITGSPLLPGWGAQAGIRPQVLRPPMDSPHPFCQANRTEVKPKSGSGPASSNGTAGTKPAPAGWLFTFTGVSQPKRSGLSPLAMPKNSSAIFL